MASAIAGWGTPSSDSSSRRIVAKEPDPFARLQHLEQCTRNGLRASGGHVDRVSDWWRSRVRHQMEQHGNVTLPDSEAGAESVSAAETVNGYLEEIKARTEACIAAASSTEGDESDESTAVDALKRELILLQSDVRRGGRAYRDNHPYYPKKRVIGDEHQTIAGALAAEIGNRTEVEDGSVVAATVHYSEIRDRFSEREILDANDPAILAAQLDSSIAFELHEILSRVPEYYPEYDAAQLVEEVRAIRDAILNRLPLEDADATTIPFPASESALAGRKDGRFPLSKNDATIGA